MTSAFPGGQALSLAAYLAYNPDMPTPFYHLSIAEEILASERLAPQVGEFLRGQRGAFLVGSVAPDVQVISGQSRRSTHFFDLPIKNMHLEPKDHMLRSYPGLAVALNLPHAQAAFIAGYLCHLQADWLWVRNIFVPVFGLRGTWGTFQQRLYTHNVLRAYVDRQIIPGLNHNIETQLRQASPHGWLPFVTDGDLSRWRDYLAGQLQPGGKIDTVEVFAERQGMSPEDYYGLIGSEEAMQREVFSHLPRNSLDEYRLGLLAESLKVLENYLGSPR
jgi:hypothetical protein